MWGLSERAIGNVTAVACMLAWSTSFLFTEDLLADWHPLLLSAVRTSMAAIVLCLVTAMIGRWHEMFQLPVIHLAGAGGIGLTAANLLLVWGQDYLDPVSTAIIISCLPAVSVAFGWFGGTERLTVVLAAGILLAIVGGTLASLGIQRGEGSESSLIGVAMIVSATVFYIWYTRTIVAICPTLSSVSKAAVCMVVSALMIIICAEVAVLSDAIPVRYELSPATLAKLLWLGAIAIGGSTALWFMAGRMVGVTVASMHHNLVPFYVMLMAVAMGDSISMQTLIGAGLVVSGAVLAQLPSRSAKARA